MYENWIEREALDLHFTMPYMREIVADLPGLLRAPSAMHYLSMLSDPAAPTSRAQAAGVSPVTSRNRRVK